MQYQIKQNDVHLQVYDEINEESEDLLLFLHGGPGSGAHAIMNLSTFQELQKTYHCVYFDQRGCGLSTYNLQQGLSKEMIASDVDVVVKEIRRRYPSKRLMIWGGSFGGLLACLYMEYYGNVDGLILSSPAICFSRTQSLALFQRNKGMMRKRLVQEERIDTRSVEEQLQDTQFLSFVFSKDNPSTSLRHICAMSSWFYLYNASSIFSSLRVPTLLMIGEDDPICDAKVLEEAYLRYANDAVEFRCIKHCGHAIFEDQQEEYILEIKGFIQSRSI